jgi:hypothetical protein
VVDNRLGDEVMDRVISNIVFTKNRPLQLEGYLRSLYRYFPSELIESSVIYKQELFAEEYDSVFGQYKDVRVIVEDDFHKDVMSIIERAKTKYILFGIDDVLFFDGVDFELIDKTFDKGGEEIFGFTLRFSPAALKNGPDELAEEQINGQTVYKLDWTSGQTPHTRYPFELCCTFYRTGLVKKILAGTMSSSSAARMFFASDSAVVKLLPVRKWRRSLLKRFGFFFSPNTLESWPCRWSQRNAEKLPRFTYFQRICGSAVQVNMVNTTTVNTTDGTEEHTVEALNEKFRQGYRFDIDYIAQHRPSQPGCGKDYFRLVKT